ncbi:MAG: thiamine-monophosphate kinase [Gammaproteobacteria bacterium]|nr:MAG: thiamine-monophosphate kinase [Gammaproteobacteria bacterium]TND07346.1 MAG: thiamine-monophosphate kinase [Gammaproteobacteria bacterium]
MPSEFELIGRYFADRGPRRRDVVLGIGDDAALLDVPAGQQLVVTMDTLVAAVHFPVATAPRAIGHKALAVNLSDLAAMGATPAWFTLALTMPQADAAWLEAFSDGMFELAERYEMQLVGGDTTRGPLSITIEAHGLVPAGRAIRRSGARAGDRIYVTGTLGDAALGLRALTGECDLGAAERVLLVRRLEYPQPRIAAGIALRDVASAAIDVSDGLAADLGHILDASGVGARIELARIPVVPSVAGYAGRSGDAGFALTGGDDYELCFTVPEERVALLASRLAGLDGGYRDIGVVEKAPGLRCIASDGAEVALGQAGYRHF